MDQPEMISGPPTLPTMGWCDKSIFGCEHSLGAKPIDEPAASSLCTETSVFAYLVMKICRPCSGRLWPCGMLAVAESSLCVGLPMVLSGLSAMDELCMENARQLATLAVVAVWKVPLGTEQCVAPRMPGTWCSGSLKADFLSQGA